MQIARANSCGRVLDRKTVQPSTVRSGESNQIEVLMNTLLHLSIAAATQPCRALAGMRAAAGTMRRTGLMVPLFVAGLLWAAPGEVRAQDADGQMHAMSMHGTALYPPDFDHFAYVNPDAPKGGTLRFGVSGSFDSLNPLITRGSPVWWVRGLVYESLAYRGKDEAFTLYGLLASSIELPDDRSYVTFTVNENARFSDGEPVTADDVIFSMELLREHGRPGQRSTYGRITQTIRVDDRTIRFELGDGSDRELPLLLGLMPILPQHAMTVEAFNETSLEPPIGTGPYRVARVDAGRLVVFERNSDYWANDEPVMRGQNNFDEIIYDYYRDETALFEAFKRGIVNIYVEGDPGRWLSEYSFPAIASGQIVQSTFTDGLPNVPSVLVFNTRRPIFADERVREALTMLFDGPWINETLFSGLYSRTEGYFHGSELSAIDRPADPAELAILGDNVALVDQDVLDGTWHLAQTDGSGRDRNTIRAALALLGQAGWTLDGGVLRNGEGQPFTFELLANTGDIERIALSYAQTLELAGIEMTIRTIDSAQFQERLRAFDFDMINFTWSQSLSPGNEQTNRFGSELANAEGSFNVAGIANPAVDAAIEALLSARGREDFVSAARAIDRALISGSYAIPLFHNPSTWIAHQSALRYPDYTPVFGYQTSTWWSQD
jgi:peptide/nickel transport system substrate-binding protein